MLKLLEGFELVGNQEELSNKYTTSGNFTLVAGRFHGRSLAGQNSNTPNANSWTFTNPTEMPECTVGFAVAMGAVPNAIITIRMRKQGSTKLRLVITPNALSPNSAILDVFMGNAGRAVSDPFPIITGGWNYIELSGRFVSNTAGTPGSVSARVNNVTMIPHTVIDGRINDVGANIGDNVDSVRFEYSAPIGQFSTRVDDVYITDGGGSINIGYQGDCTVHGLLPASEGDTVEWSGTTGNRADSINETGAHDGDLSYIESASSNKIALFNLQDIPATIGQIVGCSMEAVVRTTIPGTSKFEFMQKHAGTTRTWKTPAIVEELTTSYKLYSHVADRPPDLGVWSVSKINDAQFGVRSAV